MIPLALLIVIIGCDGAKTEPKQPEELSEESRTTAELEDTLQYQPPAPDEPVWGEGVTFNDTTRNMTIIARTPALDAIYQRAQQDLGDTLRGMISVRMVIYPDGTVGNVTLMDDWWNVDDGVAVSDSMVAQIEQWTFPPGLEEPVALTQPWRFEP
jgi:hypothetical protein